MASRPSPSAEIWCMVPAGLLWSSSTILTKKEEPVEVFGGLRRTSETSSRSIFLSGTKFQSCKNESMMAEKTYAVVKRFPGIWAEPKKTKKLTCFTFLNINAY